MKFPAFKTILLWTILILTCACQPENDLTTTISDTSNTLLVTTLSALELENDTLFNTLQAEVSLASSKDEMLHKSIHDYRIVETHAAVAQFKDYVSYSFLIDTPHQPPFTFDNYILRKQHDGTTEAFILRYAYDMHAWLQHGEKRFNSITAYNTDYSPRSGTPAQTQAAKSPCTVEVIVYHQTPQDGTYEWTPGATCHHTTQGDQCQIIIEYLITCDGGGGSGIPAPGNGEGNTPGGENPGGGSAVPDNGDLGQPIVTMEPPLGPENDANTLSHLRESIETPIDLNTTEAELQNKNNALAVYLNQLNPAVFQDLSLLLIEINNDSEPSKDDRLFLWERAKQIYDIVKTKEESATYHISSEEFFATLSSEQEAAYTENVAVTALLPAVKSAVGLQWPSSTEEWLTVFELIKPMLIEIGIEFLPLGGLYNAISDMAEGLTEGDYTLAGIGLAGVLMGFIPWTKLVKIGKALFRSGKQAFKIFKLAYPFLSQLSDALALGIKTVLDGNTVKLLKNNGDEVARISNNTMHISKHGITAADGSVVFRSADEVNEELLTLGYTNPPYDIDYPVTEFITTESEQFVRVFNPIINDANGKWLVKYSDIEGLSAEAIKNKLSLPHIPTKIVDVNVPPSTGIRTGITGEINDYEALGGGVQFELLEIIDDSNFINARDL